MSSPLPRSLRMAVIAPARAADGRVRCAMCAGLFEQDDIEIDHITPEADGGSHDPANLQPLCNPKKGRGCHRVKSVAENKARQKAKKVAEERAKAPAALIASGFALVAALIAARCTWLMYQGQPFLPWLWELHRWLGIGLLGVAALGALRALAGLATMIVPAFEDFAADGPDSTEPESREGKAQRALVNLFGAGLKVKDRNATIEMRYGDDVADHEDAFRLKVLQRMNAKMGGRWEPRWDTENNRLYWTPRPSFPSMVRHPGLDSLDSLEGERPWYLIPIADGVTIDLRITSHVLIIGKTNAGKTAVIRSIIIAIQDSASRNEAEAILVDPKRIELIGFRGWPGVRKVVTAEQEMWQFPLDLAVEMDERHRLLEEENVPLSSHPPIVVVLDEYEEYVKAMEAMWTSINPLTKKPRKQAGEKLPPPVAAVQRLLRLARKCGIHLIFGTQRPDATWFGGAARDNLQCRIGVGSLSRDAARMLFERTDIGRDLPAEAKGRITFQMLDGGFEEAQSWWVPDPGNSEGKNTDEDWQHLTRLRGALV